MTDRLLPFAISFPATSAFFINFCSWMFECGCRSLWAGAASACNVHAAHGRHCPWCSHGLAGYAIVMTALCAPQLAVSLLTRWHWTVRALVAVGLFPAIGLAAGLAFGSYDGYWQP